MKRVFVAKMIKKSKKNIVISKKNCNLASCKDNREVSEWLKEHAWKVCIRQKRIEGSNPFLSALFNA